jgi:hypothetical protein
MPTNRPRSSLPVPAINMAIIDSRPVLVRCRIDRRAHTGVGIEAQAAAQQVAEYYNILWRSAEAIDHCLSAHSWPAP